MNKIACFGSSHTEGGLGWSNDKEFINSWPGQLHDLLTETDVLNVGQINGSGLAGDSHISVVTVALSPIGC